MTSTGAEESRQCIRYTGRPNCDSPLASWLSRWGKSVFDGLSLRCLDSRAGSNWTRFSIPAMGYSLKGPNHAGRSVGPPGRLSGGSLLQLSAQAKMANPSWSGPATRAGQDLRLRIHLPAAGRGSRVGSRPFSICAATPANWSRCGTAARIVAFAADGGC
jgi:hypothetical protein